MTLRERLLAYFAANPHEELTYADAMVKFDVSYTILTSTLKRMRPRKLIEVAHVMRSPRGRA